MGRLALGMNSTYVDNYEYQDFIGGPWNQNVGIYVRLGPDLPLATCGDGQLERRRLDARLGVAHYKSGYVDQDPVDNPKVGSYATLDAYVSWAPMEGSGSDVGCVQLDRSRPAVFEPG